MYTLEDNLGPDNRENAGGLAMNIYLSHVGNFLAIQDIDTYTNPGDYVKISSDHTFTSPAGFTKLRFVSDEHSVVANGPESRDASGYIGGLEGMVVGTDEEVTAEVLHKLQTGDIIALAETANGKYLQLGTEKFPAQLRFTEDNTGKLSEGRNGQSVRIDFKQPRKIFYSGTITLKS